MSDDQINDISESKRHYLLPEQLPEILNYKGNPPAFAALGRIKYI